jgi:hypothetical protein
VFVQHKNSTDEHITAVVEAHKISSKPRTTEYAKAAWFSIAPQKIPICAAKLY